VANKKPVHKKVIKHLKGDIAGFKEEISEDEALIKKLLKRKASRKMIIDHLKDDIGKYYKEAQEDKGFIKHLKSKKAQSRSK